MYSKPLLPSWEAHRRDNDTNPRESVSGVSMQRNPGPVNDHYHHKLVLNHTYIAFVERQP